MVVQVPPRIRSEKATFDDFMILVDEDEKADLLDGVIYMASPVSISHSDVRAFLHALLGMYVDERGLGRVFGEKVAFRIGEHWSPEPDIGFVSKARQDAIEKNHVVGAPDVAIEVVSPDSIDRDYKQKLVGYQMGVTQEYWIIDPDAEKAAFLLRQGAQFVEATLTGSVFRSPAIPGFYLDVGWLWQRPLPKVRPIIEAMLAKSNKN